MKTDEVMAALWKIKEEIARENGYDLERLGAMLQEKERIHGVVSRAPSRRDRRPDTEGREVS